MSQATGSLSRVVIQKETTYKTAPGTPATTKVYYSSCSLAMSRAQSDDPTLQANRNPVAPLRETVDVAGDIVANLQAFDGLLWYGLLGQVATTGTNPYTHVFTVADSLPSFLIEKGFTDINQFFRYLGCVFSGMNVNFTASGYQAITFNIMGADEETAGTSFDGAATDLGYKAFDGLALATIEEGGAAIADVTGVDLSFDNDLDGDSFTLAGGGTRAGIAAGKVKVSGTVRARFQDLSLYTKAVSGTESKLRLYFSHGTGDGSAGNESLEILLPELIYSPQSPPISGPRGVIVELPFTAYYDDSIEASIMQVTLKNTTETIA